MIFKEYIEISLYFTLADRRFQIKLTRRNVFCTQRCHNNNGKYFHQ